ncbi:unnamed protein product [Tenebrio molitor]|jgi:hypothetical protein|nr:unnamed protein product [Tenebrio molitor]
MTNAIKTLLQMQNGFLQLESTLATNFYYRTSIETDGSKYNFVYCIVFFFTVIHSSISRKTGNLSRTF